MGVSDSKYPVSACAALLVLAAASKISAMDVRMFVSGCGNGVYVEANDVKAGDNPEPQMSKLVGEVCPSGHTQVVKAAQLDASGNGHISWTFECVDSTTQAKANPPASKSC